MSLFTALLAITLVVTPVFAEIDPGEVLVNFTVQNLDQNASANVFVTYIDAATGAQTRVPGANYRVIPKESSFIFQAAESGLDSGFNGSAIVSSDKETAAFGSMLWQNGNAGQTAAAYEAFRQGVQTLYFPTLVARPDKQYADLTIQSAEGAANTEISVNIKFYTRNGELDADINKSIFRGRSITINLRDELLASGPGNTGDSATKLRWTEADGWIGSAVVTSGSPLAGVGVVYWPEYTGAYSGLTTGDGGTKNFIPLVARRVNSDGDWLQFSSISVQNLDPDDDADVKLTFYSVNGTEVHSFTDTVPANSPKVYNTRFGSDGSDWPSGADNAPSKLGTDYQGALVVESTSGQNIVTVVNGRWTETTSVGLAATIFTSQVAGYQKLYVPGTFRRFDENSGKWLQFTNLIVQNVGPSSCDDFTVDFRNNDTGDTEFTFQDSLDSQVSHGYNTRFADTSEIPDDAADNIADDLGDGYRGAVVISAPSGCQLIALHNTLWPAWTESTAYNAFGAQ
jgi:hypothetical protein